MLFATNEINYIILDYDNLEDSEKILEYLIETNLKIHIISKEVTTEEIESTLWINANNITVFDDDLSDFLAARAELTEDLFITSSIDHVDEANNYLVGTILIKTNPTYTDIKAGADLTITPNNLSTISKNDFFAGIAGEMHAYPFRSTLPGFKENDRYHRKYLRFTTNHPEIDKAYSLGRFFNKDDHFRPSHFYTQYIKFIKNNPTIYKDELSEILKQAIDYILKTEKISEHILTYVPSQPRDKVDRNEVLLRQLQKASSIKYEKLVLCPKNYTKQKEVTGGTDARRDNIRGKFRAPPETINVPVIIFDDVYTTGSTLAECARVLKAQGTPLVITLSLASVCTPTNGRGSTLECSHCGAPMQIRFRNSDGRPFWGCTKYSSNEIHETYNIQAGYRKLKEARE